MGKKNLPLDWKPSIPNAAIFQIPPRERKALKIITPSRDDPNVTEPQTESSDISKTSNQISRSGAGDGGGDGTTRAISNVVVDNPKKLPKNASFTPSYGKDSGIPQSLPQLRLIMKEEDDREFLASGPAVYDGQNLSANPSIDATYDDHQQWRPDIFAHAFVPRSLTAINDSPAFFDNSVASQGIDYEAYTSTFAIPRFLPTAIEPSHWDSSSNPLVDHSAELTPNGYCQHFRDCLVLDMDAQTPELRSYDLFKVPLETFGVRNTYRVKVPGLREGTPSVDFADYVMLRQLILDPVTRLPQGMDAWLAPGGGCSRGDPAPGFTKVQTRAIVIGVDKVNEFMIIYANGLLPFGVPMCNVSFLAQSSLAQSLHRAVTGVSQYILEQIATPMYTKTSRKTSIERTDNNWLRCMLFPQQREGIQQTTLPSVIFSQTWIDTSLNYEQKVTYASLTLKRSLTGKTESS